MSAESLNADELIVKAEFIAEYPKDEFSLYRVHDRVLRVMELEGYTPRDPRDVIMSRRAITFLLKPREKEREGLWKNLSNSFSHSSDLEMMDYHEQLGSTADSTLFQVQLRFYPSEYDDKIRLRIEANIIPAVVRQHEQVRHRSDYNPQNVVRSCKEFARTLAVEFGWIFYVEPYTPAHALKETIDENLRGGLVDMLYGQKVVQFADDADQAFKYDLRHSALASYIIAVEWMMIAHLKTVGDLDVIEKENGVPGFNYGMLLGYMKDHGKAHQITLENLEKHRTDRHVMAHHKDGSLSYSHVHSVKDTLKHLIEETIQQTSGYERVPD